jgi:hypothetical protein
MRVEENKKILDDMNIEIKRRIDNRMHATELLPNMVCLEDKPADKPECFYDSGFIPNVDDVDRYDKYIGAELMFDFLARQ